MLTFTLILEHVWSTRPSYLLDAEHLCTQGKDVFFLSASKIFLAPTFQEGSFRVMFVGTQHTEEQKELNTCERKDQNATKITSAFADSCFQFPWPVMSNLMRILSVPGSHELLV